MNILKCPDDHKIKRKEIWEDNKHLYGEEVCTSCCRRARYDITFLVGAGGTYTKFAQRVDGKWSYVDCEESLN